MYFLDIGLYQFCVFISALNFINIFNAIVLYNYIFLAGLILDKSIGLPVGCMQVYAYEGYVKIFLEIFNVNNNRIWF
jgi:hypothetical protein